MYVCMYACICIVADSAVSFAGARCRATVHRYGPRYRCHHVLIDFLSSNNAV